MTEVGNRSEVLFLYDIKDANPNGDPMDENKPRIDEETEINIVTDVRLKRTIRDYLHRFRHKEIFIVEEIKEDGTQKTREERIADLKIKSKEDEQKLLEKYIDLRLFGATIALKGKDKESDERGRGKSITWIGPVQFRFGRSLHKVEVKTIKGTSVMPSRAEAKKGTIIETQVLPYSLICFYGIVNENAAKSTNLSEEDIDLLLDGMWNGTKNLITRSKVGQLPRFLLRVIYKATNYHIGDLDKKLVLIKKKDDKEIRDVSDYDLDISGLIAVLEKNKTMIERIQICTDDALSLVGPEGRPVEAKGLGDELRKIAPVEVLTL